MMADGSAIDLDIGPAIENNALQNYRTLKAILLRLTSLCVTDLTEKRKSKKHEQRLLRNMGAHTVVLELLQIPYEKVLYMFSIFYCVLKQKLYSSCVKSISIVIIYNIFSTFLKSFLGLLRNK